jgi:hypothetical protein
MWWWMTGLAVVLGCLGLAILLRFLQRASKQDKGNKPPEEIYPLW